MAAPTYAKRRAEYARLWDSAEIQRSADADVVARRIIKNRARYEAVETATGVPWEFIAVLHNRESGGDFAGVLHNGEKILGTGRKTRLEPKDRGPFKTWLEAAIDAVVLKKFDKVRDWCVERCLYSGEMFNGWGYFFKKVPSAYLWAGTNVYKGGKYVSDHNWDPNAQDKQLGMVPVMVRLMALDHSITFSREATAAVAAAQAAPSIPQYGPGTRDNAGLKAVQERLRVLGYASVGMPDGDWGTKTETALGEFQRDNGLPVTSDYDVPTAAALPTAVAKVPTGPRATVTAADLRAAGSTEAKASQRNGLIGMAVGVPTLVGGAVQGTATYFGEAVRYVQHAKDILDGVPWYVWFAATLAISFAIWWNAKKATEAKVAAVRSGQDAGPIGLAQAIMARAANDNTSAAKEAA